MKLSYFGSKQKLLAWINFWAGSWPEICGPNLRGIEKNFGPKALLVVGVVACGAWELAVSPDSGCTRSGIQTSTYDYLGILSGSRSGARISRGCAFYKYNLGLSA